MSSLAGASAQTSADRTYRGEVWGDLKAEGYIWGEHIAEEGMVSLRQWRVNSGDALKAIVTNISEISFSNRSDISRVSTVINCTNRTLEIIVIRGSFYGDFSDIDMRCVYTDVNYTFKEPPDYEFMDETARWVTGSARAGRGPDEHPDLWLDNCTLVVDGRIYSKLPSCAFFKEGEVVNFAFFGTGGLRVAGGLHPHICGTLEVEQFVHVSDGSRKRYARIVFSGPDVSLLTIDNPRYTTGGGPFESYDPLEVEVAVSAGDVVEFERLGSTVGMSSYLVVGAIASVFATCVIVYYIYHRGRRRPGSRPGARPPRPNPPIVRGP